MQEKLHDFMNRRGLKPSQLAAMLGINPAAVSHILSGRNKPSFELLQKMLRRFPELNPDWLLLDQGDMFRPNDDDLRQPSAASPQTATPEQLQTDEPSALNQSAMQTASVAIPQQKLLNGRRISRVVLCFDDGTFTSYTPENNRP